MRRQSETTSGRRRRLGTLAALLLAALALVPSSTALAQEPPDPNSPIALVNEDDEDLVDRKKDGRFIARPVFDREMPILYYGVRDGDTGEWIAPMFRVRGGEKERRDGWEYSFEYPFEDGQPELDPERPYLLVILAKSWAEVNEHFYAVIPPHQPGGLWNKVLRALDPPRWGKAIATWLIEGAHGMLCGVVERASGAEAETCEVSP
ncbi:MAG: hypothetical protein OXS47_11990 [Chloroflexota bacterium]|nr:hypothetical protein [Chloroflexota bacterium]